MPAPKITAVLLRYLEEQFPDRIPNPDVPVSLERLIGEQRVIRHLRHVHQEQNPLETADG